MYRLRDATRRFWLIVIGLVASGILIIVMGGLFASGSWHEIVYAIGAAPIVAALLAVSVDQWLKLRLVEDAFRAAIGYVLPEALRREMEWFYSLKVTCAELTEDVRLEEDGDLVVANIRLDRVFRNETDEPQKLCHDFAVEEWHHQGRRSEIVAVGPPGVAWTRGEDRHAVSGVCDEPITLEPRARVRCWDEATEIKRRSDTIVFFVRHATSNIRVNVQAPPGLGVYVDVATRQPERITTLGEHVYRFDGTLLPYQAIRVRWFPVSN